MQRSLVMGAAWLEIIVGAILIALLDFPCRLLFAATPAGAGLPLGRFAGVGLMALGIACLPSAEGPRRGAVLGLFAFNAGTAVLFAWVGLTTTFRGLLLWPAAGLHAVIATALLVEPLTRPSFVPKSTKIGNNQSHM